MKLYLKMLAVSVAAVIIAVGGYRLFFYRAAETGITVSAPAYDGADRISAIQRELIRAGFYDGDADGVPDEEFFCVGQPVPGGKRAFAVGENVAGNALYARNPCP